ncbi:MAG: OmpA family protein [Pseudomonadota bacterium]
MRCRPWLWLWGLLPLALVVFLGIIGERERIERDLTVRTEQTLDAEGLGWARLSFEGRDGVISGAAPSNADRVLAGDIAARVHGVRIVRNDAAIEVAASPYSWQGQKRRDGTVVISGFVPDGATRDLVANEADTRFGNRARIELKTARGEPSGVRWSDATRFALRQLPSLREGRVMLSDATLEIGGTAATPEAYDRLVAALDKGLPGGITVARRDIEPPTIEAYVWSFDRLGDDVVLNGYVPDTGTRARLAATAKRLYPDATITNRLRIARGEPKGFVALAEAALEETKSFREVRIAVADGKVTATGLAKTDRDAAKALTAIASQSPTLVADNQVRALRKVPPRASPYIFRLDEQDGRILLRGHVPDEEARRTILSAVQERFAGATITDELELASGLPGDRTDWVAGVERAIRASEGLSDVNIGFSDTTVRLDGGARDADAEARVSNLLAALGGPFEATSRIRLLEPEVDREAEARAAAEQAERERLARIAEEKAEEERRAREAAERARLAREAEEREVAARAEQERAEEERAEQERIARAAAEEAKRARLAEIEAEKAAKAEEERLAQEAAEKAAKEAAEEAERLRLAQKAAEEAAAAAEQERLAREAAARAAREAAERAADARRAEREARRAEYALVAEYNGTPLALWKAREARSREGGDPADVDAAAFADAATDSSGRVVLSGKVASPAMRIALRRAARDRFDGGVVDRMEVLDGAPDPDWQEAAELGLAQLSRLRNGALIVTTGTLDLYGDAVTPEAANAVRRSVDRGTPVRFDVSSLVRRPRTLDRQEVDEAVAGTTDVDAGLCGNVMNTLTTLVPITFDSEKSDLKPEAMPTLEKLAAVAARCPKSRIRVAGHTDNRGPEGYNQRLSEDRAEAVLSFLADKGIDRSRMRARGLGESQPLVPNTTRDNRAKNRRIEFTVTEQDDF